LFFSTAFFADTGKIDSLVVMVATDKFGPEPFSGNKIMAQQSEEFPAGEVGKQMEILLY
jgi:hypothetical protein